MRRFNVYIAVLSLVADCLLLVLGLILAYQIRATNGELYAWPFITYLKLTAVMLPVWIAMLASQQLYNVRNAPRGWNVVPRLLIGLMAGWALMIIAFYFWRNTAAENFPRLVIIYGIALTTGLTLLGKLLIAGIIQLSYSFGLGLVKTAVIATENSTRFIESLKKERRTGRHLVAVLTSPDLEKLAQLHKEGLTEVVVASALPDEPLLKLLTWAEASNVSLVTVPSLMSVRATNIEPGILAGTTVMYFRRSPLEGWGRIYKRFFDLLIVIPALIILSPIMLLLFIGSQIATGSGMIKQARIGQDGRTFTIHKFRSMYVDWPKRFPKIRDWSSDEETDPRITGFGRIIRKTNLDELAQLWDVFVGKMSLVGPRPEQPKYVEKFAIEVPDYLRRHHVKSGLTGWAQINGARGNTPITERVKYDLYYIENWSIWFDFRIILATFVYVFRQLASSSQK